MAAARIKNPSCIVIKGTNLTRPELGHIIEGPFTTAASCISGGFATLSSAGVVTACASKSKPAGFIVHRQDYNWGTTTIALGATLPTGIDIYLCSFGCGVVPCDVSQIANSSIKESHVFANAAGLAAASPALVTGVAGEFNCGTVQDLLAGNTGTGTGGADNDPMEIFFGKGDMDLVSTS
jgi:hypothetical protein